MAGSSSGSNIESWHLNKTEIAYNLEATASTQGDTEAAQWKLNVPKIMPLVAVGIPKETVTALSPSIFINDKACKPTIQNSVKTRNYLVATRPANCSFKFQRKKHGIQLEVEVLHENLDNLRITNTIDNSNP